MRARLAAVVTGLLTVLGCMACGIVGIDPTASTLSVSFGAGADGVAGLQQEFMTGEFKHSPFANSWIKTRQSYRVQVMAQVSVGTAPYSISLTSAGTPLEGFSQNKQAGMASGFVYVRPGTAVTIRAQFNDATGPQLPQSFRTPPAPAAPVAQDAPQIRIEGLNPSVDPCRPSLKPFTIGEDSSYFEFWWTWDQGPVHYSETPLLRRFDHGQFAQVLAQDDRPGELGRPLGSKIVLVCK